MMNNITTQLTIGTEKQIAYANKLRDRMVCDINIYIGNMRKHAERTNPDQLPLLEQLEAYISGELDKINDSVWWIEQCKKNDYVEFVKPFQKKFLEKITGNLPQRATK